MGLMDQMGQVVGGLLGGQSAQNPLLQAVASLLGNNSNIGGLAGLVQAFQKNGLGEMVNSWVSTGQNIPATPQHIEQGLGSDLLKQLAGKAGLSPQDVSAQLSDLLPNLVDNSHQTARSRPVRWSNSSSWFRGNNKQMPCLSMVSMDEC